MIAGELLADLAVLPSLPPGMTRVELRVAMPSASAVVLRAAVTVPLSVGSSIVKAALSTTMTAAGASVAGLSPCACTGPHTASRASGKRLRRVSVARHFPGGGGGGDVADEVAENVDMHDYTP